jgi:predicted unusual protein kinase regulating ubiquinone biosynthesis (AarF/ABC1/UbiB family)
MKEKNIVPLFRSFRIFWVIIRVFLGYLSLLILSPLIGKGNVSRLISRRHQKYAQLVVQTIINVKGLFIKIGQLISIMTNFLPEEFIKWLEKLQDQIPPRPYEEVKATIIKELNAPPEELFLSFEKDSIASASLAQVHLVRLKSGEQAAIKIQHQRIEEIAKVDLKLLKYIFKILSFFMPEYGLERVCQDISKTIKAELDFYNEGKNIEKIAKNFKENKEIKFPQVFWQYTTHRILCLEYIKGEKVTNIQKIEEMNLSRAEIAQLILEAYCQMIFVDGIYHADPHPGNILVNSGPTITFLDFGAIGILSADMQEGIPIFLEGVLKRDTTRIIYGIRKMGFVAQKKNEEIAEQIIEYFHRRFQEEIRIEDMSLKELKFDLRSVINHFMDLKKMEISLKDLTTVFHIPKDWILLERTLLLLMGLCTHLDPQMDPMKTIQPYMERFVFGKSGDLSKLIIGTAKDLAFSYFSLPGELRGFIRKAVQGRLKVECPDFTSGARLIYRLGHQLIYTIFAGLSGVFSFLFYIRGESLLLKYSLIIGIFFLSLLGGSMLLGAKKGKTTKF